MRNVIALSLVLAMVLMACVTTTTTLPDGTVIEEKAPDMEAIMQAITFAELAIDRLEARKAVADEREQARLEREQVVWQARIEMLVGLLQSLDGAEVERRFGLQRN